MDITTLYDAVFKRWSFNNPMYSKASFHTLIGQIIKEQTVNKGAVKVDARINTAILQDSGSGKSTPSDFITKLGEGLGLRIRTVDEFTDASLLGTIEEVYENVEGELVKDYAVNPGLLETSDILHWDEGSTLFNPKPHQISTLNFLQKALNPIGSQSNHIYKKLARGPEINIYPTCSILLTTYYPENIVAKVAATGFLQRLLVVPRRLSTNDRELNAYHDIEVLGVEIDFEEGIGMLIDRLSEVRNFSTGEKIKFTPTIKPVLKNKVTGFLNLIKTPNERISRLLHTFLPRYQNFLYLLSMHHASLRLDSVVKTQDVRYANDLIENLFTSIISWLESDTELADIPKREQLYLHKMFEAYKQTQEETNDEFVQSSKFVKILEHKLSLTKPTIYSYINMFVDRGFIEKKKQGRSVSYKMERNTLRKTRV